MKTVIWPHPLRFLHLADPHRAGLVLSLRLPEGGKYPPAVGTGDPPALAQGVQLYQDSPALGIPALEAQMHSVQVESPAP